VLPTSTVPPGSAAPPAAVRALDVLASEWIKLWSARSTYVTLSIAAVLAVGLSGLGTYLTSTVAAHPPPGSPPPPDALTLSFTGFPTAQLAVAVLGVLAFTAEHATGLIRTTFAAVPRRPAVLAAKAATAGTVVVAAGEVLAFASFFLTQAILSGHHRGLSLAHPGVPAAVLAGGFYLAVVALLGLGLGAALRSTAAAIAVAVMLTYLVPEILSLLPSPWNGRINRFLPLTAAQQLVSLHPRTDMFAPALSLLVVIGWAVAVLAAACVVIIRRDA
jgi:hypothetical protein